MKKLLLIIPLCLLAAMCLTACDNIDPDASINVTETATIEPSPFKTATPEATPSPSPSPSPSSHVSIPLQQKIKMTDAQRSGKVAYITIDDGPSKNTLAILNVLKEKGVKVTFFVLGKNAENNPKYLKAIADAGHVIGNHSYSHVYKQIYASPETLKSEIEHTNSIIKNIVGQDYKVTVFRFPGGLKQNDSAYAQVVYGLGMDYYAWSIDPQDSVGRKSSAKEIIAKFNKQLRNQQHPVILLHDANNKDTTVEALSLIIDELKAKGYSFDVIRTNR